MAVAAWEQRGRLQQVASRPPTSSAGALPSCGSLCSVARCWPCALSNTTRYWALVLMASSFTSRLQWQQQQQGRGSGLKGTTPAG